MYKFQNLLIFACEDQLFLKFINRKTVEHLFILLKIVIRNLINFLIVMLCSNSVIEIVFFRFGLIETVAGKAFIAKNFFKF